MTVSYLLLSIYRLDLCVSLKVYAFYRIWCKTYVGFFILLPFVFFFFTPMILHSSFWVLSNQKLRETVLNNCFIWISFILPISTDNHQLSHKTFAQGYIFIRVCVEVCGQDKKFYYQNLLKTYIIMCVFILVATIFHLDAGNCWHWLKSPYPSSCWCCSFAGERPFKCSECGKAFNQKGALQTHMIKHTGEKPHACAFCPAAFSQKGNLQSHIQRVHSEVNAIIHPVLGANTRPNSVLLFLCAPTSIDLLL